MKRGSRDEWLHEVAARQAAQCRLPDTARNEATFWRNIISGKRHLTIAQITGIGIMWVAMGFPLWALLKWMRYSLFAWVALGLCGAGFLLLRWGTLKALSNTERRSNRSSKVL
jgi:hypothetical protein